MQAHPNKLCRKFIYFYLMFILSHKFNRIAPEFHFQNTYYKKLMQCGKWRRFRKNPKKNSLSSPKKSETFFNY